jgi:hypothetical protein
MPCLTMPRLTRKAPCQPEKAATSRTYDRQSCQTHDDGTSGEASVRRPRWDYLGRVCTGKLGETSSFWRQRCGIACRRSKLGWRQRCLAWGSDHCCGYFRLAGWGGLLWWNGLLAWGHRLLSWDGRLTWRGDRLARRGSKLRRGQRWSRLGYGLGGGQ